MTAVRGALGAVGVVLVAVGAWHVLSLDLADLVVVVVWLAVGVLLHDAVLAPLTALAGVAVLPRLPAWCRAPVVAGAVLLVTVTLGAVPVLGRFGAKPDDPGLLPRAYGAWWLLLVVLVVVVVLAASLRRRAKASD